MDGLNKTVRILDKVGVFSRWTNVAGIAFLFLMVSFTFVDVVMRYIFNRPIKGVLEITEVMMILAIFLAVAHTHNEKSHISVDLITSRLAPKSRLVMEFITTLLGLGIFGIAVWRIVIQTVWFVQHNSMHSQHFPIVCAPFASVIALGCTALWLLLLRDLLGNVAESLRLGLTRYHWLLMLGVPILVIILAIFWMQPDLWQLSLPIVGIIGVIFSLIFFLSGMPISFALILTSFIFISHIRGLDVGLDMVGTELYRTTGSYSWSVLPFFVLLGYFSLFARFGEDLYLAAYKWVGHMRGGLAIATVGACTGFAAIVGDSVAATATMGSVSLPQMQKYQYDNRLSTGSITGGATLGPIIPPSVAFIIFGVLTGVSIGDLFVAGIFPGLLMAATFVLVIFAWCRRNPTLGPPGERSAWRPRLVSLKAGGPVAVLFLLVIGGIYAGIFTPTEGGAIGAVGAILIGLVMRRFTWKSFAQSLQDSGKVISAVFLILIGALMFTRFAAWCNLSGVMADFITGLGLSPAGFMLLVLLTFFILGFFIDMMPLLLIGVPILYPIAVALGINPIWFGVLVVVVINLGASTPPVGINLFTLKGVAKDIPIGTIYTGVLPFVLATVVAICIIFAVPSLATWLPGILK
jgi:tripartite ATP-independent transporter DctM subunit